MKRLWNYLATSYLASFSILLVSLIFLVSGFYISNIGIVLFGIVVFTICLERIVETNRKRGNYEKTRLRMLKGGAAKARLGSKKKPTKIER